MSEWKHLRLGDVADIRHGYAFKGEYFREAPTHFLLLTPGNFAIGGGFQDKAKYYDGPIPENYVLAKDDLVVTMTDLSKQGDTLGYSALVPASDRYLHNQRIGLVTIKSSDILKEFLYWVMRTRNYQRFIVGHASGSTVKHTSPRMILSYEFDAPPLHLQRIIMETLSALDEKVANNTKINNHLEQMAQAIFKSWFVDFEPWGGVVPEDWREVPLGEVVEMSTKALNPQSCPDTILEHYSIPAFDETRLPVFELASEVKSNKYIIDKNCFMISKLNPTIKRIWRPYCATGHAVCSTEFIVYRAKNPTHMDFYYSVVDSPPFSDFLLSHITGSTGSRQRAIPSETLSFLTVVPSDDVIKDFCDKVAAIYAHFEQNHLESRRLRQVRDSLLPRLMSGELSVADVDAK
jgi:type I restriction enzyme S subunit